MYSSKNNARHLATLGPLGYSKAPGTVGSAVALLLVYITHRLIADFFVYTLFILASSCISLFIINKARTQFNVHDAPQIILDEVLGCLFCFYGLTINLKILIVGFLLFRFFDITKCFGIRRLEKLPGAWGIISDDIACGVLTNGLLRCLLLLDILKV